MIIDSIPELLFIGAAVESVSRWVATFDSPGMLFLAELVNSDLPESSAGRIAFLIYLHDLEIIPRALLLEIAEAPREVSWFGLNSRGGQA